MKELVHFQSAIFCAIEDPSHIECGLVEDEETEETAVPEEIIQAEATRQRANDQLGGSNDIPNASRASNYLIILSISYAKHTPTKKTSSRYPAISIVNPLISIDVTF
jgi:hypothetical protein